MPTDERGTQSPQSVTRVIRILEALGASPGPMSLADLARALDAPKSSLAALLRGLAEEGFVTPADGAWQLGPGAFGLSSALLEARRRLQSSDLVRDGMRRLADRCGETVLFGVRDEDGETLTYVDVIESQKTVRFIVPVGDRRPLYSTAGGRALLAAGTDEDLRRYLERLKPEAFTSETLTAKRALGEAITTAREAGVAQTIDQASEGVTGTASPIRDAAGTVIGVLIVAAPSLRLADRLAELKRLVKDEAGTISRSLGYRAKG
ncbi:IclR family transcriptional regulator [Novosphingobium sp. G106]|uniref:IclR family transcriptional regulator n=1 Tax=Novosphingobium sp. G106 TaxID=2849500 RepID=UPI001C2CF590|nr:IclR family transcriptional regulator [Novosphingobium sp. G106]MBV1690932.1 IclR family transcriptional regulator [Novosphingobium sp. G106]